MLMNLKKWTKPQIRKLSVIKYTLSGSINKNESNGHPTGKPK